MLDDACNSLHVEYKICGCPGVLTASVWLTGKNASCILLKLYIIYMFYKLQEQFHLLLKLIFTLIKPKIATCKLNCSLHKDIFSFKSHIPLPSACAFRDDLFVTRGNHVNNFIVHLVIKRVLQRLKVKVN